jgi:CarD family transcriptional regulator
MVLRDDFNIGDFVVYPAHGVGKLIDIEIHDICDTTVELFVIEFNKDHMVLKIPVQKACSSGLRLVCCKTEMETALESLGIKSKKKKVIWSRRAQEYESKINSGDIMGLADVIRELHSGHSDGTQSYSERLIYQTALDRFIRELSIVEEVNEDEATKKVHGLLNVA